MDAYDNASYTEVIYAHLLNTTDKKVLYNVIW